MKPEEKHTFINRYIAGYNLEEGIMNPYKNYKKKGRTEMRPYIEGEVLPNSVSISEADKANGSPKAGDMIARNPNNPNDMWLVAKDYFEANYEEAYRYY